MKIWVVAVGEPSLIDKGERLHRAGLMADHYSEIGHKVTLFNSTFFHQKKINRFKKSEIYGGIEKDLMDQIFERLQDKFSGIRTIKIFNQEKNMMWA